MGRFYQKKGKRLFDIGGALAILCIFFPLMIVVAAINCFDQRCVFFRQARLGRDDKPFRILKFKTVKIINGKPAITPFANFLRSHSLDEIPQLFNVLSGEMSLVGPRPLFPEYLPYYSQEEKKRHHIKPGITGSAQINGGNDLSWDEKLRLDLYYVQNYSLMMDLKILLWSLTRIFTSTKHWDVRLLSEERAMKVKTHLSNH